MSIQNVAACSRLAAILKRSPHLGQYVKILSLNLHEMPLYWTSLEPILSTTNRVERLAIVSTIENGIKTSLCLSSDLIDLLSLESLRGAALANLNNAAREFRRRLSIRNRHSLQKRGRRIHRSDIPFVAAFESLRLDKCNHALPHSPSAPLLFPAPHAPLSLSSS
ncbi:hypothetical protein C8R45DRAFT_992726 [Mycena sanguinolenta]|nr:hypothetical protein C8R45DRAFT_992726 [Mycena sanguinolenta]